MKPVLLLCLLTNSMYASSIGELVRQKFCLSQRTLKQFESEHDDKKRDFWELYHYRHYKNSEYCTNSIAALFCLLGCTICCNDPASASAAIPSLSGVVNHCNMQSAAGACCLLGCCSMKCFTTSVFPFPFYRQIGADKPCMKLYDWCTCWESTSDEMRARMLKTATLQWHQQSQQLLCELKEFGPEVTKRVEQLMTNQCMMYQTQRGE